MVCRYIFAMGGHDPEIRIHTQCDAVADHVLGALCMVSAILLNG